MTIVVNYNRIDRYDRWCDRVDLAIGVRVKVWLRLGLGQIEVRTRVRDDFVFGQGSVTFREGLLIPGQIIHHLE